MKITVHLVNTKSNWTYFFVYLNHLIDKNCEGYEGFETCAGIE